MSKFHYFSGILESQKKLNNITSSNSSPLASYIVRHKACYNIVGNFFLDSWSFTIMTWLQPNSIGGLWVSYWLLYFSYPLSTKNNRSISTPSRIIGLGPTMLDRSFFKRSIVFGKKSSIRVTKLFATSKIWLWLLKFTVNCLMIGTFIPYWPICLGWKRDLRSQNLKPTPFAIFWAVSPAKKRLYSVILESSNNVAWGKSYTSSIIK